MMKTYELQTYNQGAWKIDSMYDDPELAVEEARRVEESKRYSGIRVIEETYDEETDSTATRTIFRGGIIAPTKRERKAPPPVKRAKSAAAPRKGASREPVRRAPRQAKPKQGSALVPMLMLLVCVTIAAVALFGLRQLELLH